MIFDLRLFGMETTKKRKVCRWVKNVKRSLWGGMILVSSWGKRRVERRRQWVEDWRLGGARLWPGYWSSFSLLLLYPPSTLFHFFYCSIPFIFPSVSSPIFQTPPFDSRSLPPLPLRRLSLPNSASTAVAFICPRPSPPLLPSSGARDSPQRFSSEDFPLDYCSLALTLQVWVVNEVFGVLGAGYGAGDLRFPASFIDFTLLCVSGGLL